MKKHIFKLRFEKFASPAIDIKVESDGKLALLSAVEGIKEGMASKGYELANYEYEEV